MCCCRPAKCPGKHLQRNHCENNAFETGILTDLGALTGNKVHGLPVDTKRFKLLSIIVGAFIAGGYLGSLSYFRWNAWAMLIPALLIGFSAIGYELFRRRLKGTIAD